VGPGAEGPLKKNFEVVNNNKSKKNSTIEENEKK
jgi:hypothetical protein